MFNATEGNSQCQENFCSGAECLCFSCDYLKYWLIFNLDSDEEIMTPYAQWTTRKNDSKFCTCDCSGPLVREFCNSLWSKANCPKWEIKVNTSKLLCLYNNGYISIYIKLTMDFAKYLFRGDEVLSRERKILNRHAIFVQFD